MQNYTTPKRFSQRREDERQPNVACLSYCSIIQWTMLNTTIAVQEQADMKQTTLKVGDLLTPLLVGITKVVWKGVYCFFSAAYFNEQWQMVKIWLNPKQLLKIKRYECSTFSKDISKDTNKDKNLRFTNAICFLSFNEKQSAKKKKSSWEKEHIKKS